MAKWLASFWRIKDPCALRIVVEMMTDDVLHDQLHLALAARSQSYYVEEIVNDNVSGKIVPREVTPHLYSLDHECG